MKACAEMTMDPREQRGLVIAATSRKIRRKGDNLWLVPSQSNSGNGAQPYVVNLEKKTCTCLDFQEGGNYCKHLHAVKFVIQREFQFDEETGTTTETETVLMQTVKKTTYKQNWPLYNLCKTTEKSTFQVLLHDLCSAISDDRQPGRGRPRIPLADAIFSVAYKIYSGMSGRRFMTDMREAHAAGHTSRTVHYNSIFDILEAPETGAILQALIVASAAPLKALEGTFAVDSSGFSGCKFDRWFDEKWGEPRSERSWVKLHAMVGTKTGIITALEVEEKFSGDSPRLQPLMHQTAKQFKINDLCADMAYLSEGNLQAITDIGATPLIPFKSNSKPNRPGVWNKAYHWFNLHREEFLKRYHQRSNIESAFSAIKRVFGDSVRSKTEVSMRNEALCKCLCHNICVLIHAMHEFGIELNFRAESPLARQITAG
jgi:transposase